MIKKLLPIIMILAVSASCNYLDVTPTGKVIPDKVSDFRAMMTSAYNKIPAHRRLLTVRGDEVLPYNFGPFFGTYVDVALWNDVAPDPVTVKFPWTEIYNVIFYTNSVIADVMTAKDDSPGDPAGQVKGEALMLRAFMHFELLNMYAKYYDPATAETDRGIPLSLTIDINQEFKPAPVEKVYRQILADIEEGMSLMTVEDQTVSTRYRFSLKSGKAFEAKVRLFRMEWEKALELAESILPSCPLSDLRSGEIAVPPYYHNSEEAILSADGLGTVDLVNDMSVSYDFMNIYNTGKVGSTYVDGRVGIYFRQGYDGSFVSKKYSGSKSERSTFRSAEIYLMAAEAAAHLPGKLQAAKDYMKQLLATRLESGYYAVRSAEIDAMDAGRLLADIWDERGRELALEGHRWYDLRRTTRPRIEKSFFNMEFDELSGVLEKDDARYTIRFPKDAIAGNPGLGE